MIAKHGTKLTPSQALDLAFELEFENNEAIENALQEVRAEYGETIGPKEAHRLATDMVAKNPEKYSNP